jgi:hypothetical protein
MGYIERTAITVWEAARSILLTEKKRRSLYLSVELCG